MTDQHVVEQELVVPSTPDQIQVVEERAEAMAREAGFADDERDSIAIAITEMVANAIFHGNKSDPTKQVRVRFTMTAESFTIAIRDQGRGFNPEKVADPLQPENLLKDSGRGIFIVRTLMDQIDIHSGPEGTEVVLIKKKKR